MNLDFKMKCEKFMYIYMYELEKALNNNIKALKDITFQVHEANVDKPLKEFIKEFIENGYNKIPLDTMEKVMEIDRDNKTLLSYRDFKDIYIEKVYLPSELTEELKQYRSMSRDSVYTDPDLYFEITDGINKYYISVELKSTKDNSIPGSSIQQIIPNEWVIFIRHNKSGINVVTGRYIHSINSKMQFPDRSPRPKVSFRELEEWNNNNRYETDSKVIYKTNLDDERTKYQLLSNWQDYLADRWIEILFKDSIKKNEPWFNNNLRIFTLKFIDRYETLSADEKENYKIMLQKLIKEYEIPTP